MRFCLWAVFIIIGSSSSMFLGIQYAHIVDLMTGGAAVDIIFAALWVVVGIHIMLNAAWRTAAYIGARTQTAVSRDLDNTSFAFLHKHSFAFFQNNFVGALVKKVNRFSGSFDHIMSIIMWDFLTLVVYTTAALIILGNELPWFAVILLGWVVVYALLNYWYSLFKLKYDAQRAELNSKATAVLADTITNSANVKLFTGYDRERKRYWGVTDRLRHMRRFTWDLGTHFQIFQGVSMITLEIAMISVGIIFWQRGVLSIGDFVLVQMYITLIGRRMWDLGRVIRDFYERVADAEEMTEIFMTPHEVVDVPSAKPISVSGGEVEFRNVGFAYHKTRSVIKKMNLTIASGEKIALVGPSGAGKSTLVKLLLRQYDVSSGKILIDGQKISRATLESLWQHISYVPQDPVLFHRPLMENIRYGRPDATDEEVMEAAKQAHCHEFISAFPQGYDTLVGERGVKLSGGERQRVAIARAILRNAPILILDEATSSLDSVSEHLIQDALDTLMKEKTTIIIAHRLSTIMKMDRILVLEQGEIVEEGTHASLLKKKDGLYKELWHMQSGGFLG